MDIFLNSIIYKLVILVDSHLLVLQNTYLYIRQFLLPTYLFKSPNIFSKVWDGPSVECVLFKTFLDFHQNLVKLGEVVGHIGYLLHHHQVLSNSDQKQKS